MQKITLNSCQSGSRKSFDRLRYFRFRSFTAKAFLFIEETAERLVEISIRKLNSRNTRELQIFLFYLLFSAYYYLVPYIFFFCYLLCVFRYWLRDFSNLLANTYIVVARCVPCEINVMSSEKKLILLIQLQHKKNNNYTLMYIFLQMHLVRAIKQIIKVHWKLRFCRFAFS